MNCKSRPLVDTAHQQILEIPKNSRGAMKRTATIGIKTIGHYAAFGYAGRGDINRRRAEKQALTPSRLAACGGEIVPW
jgi:hypothetical protein